MKVQVSITLEDQSSEEQMAARGVTREQLLEIYTEAFTNLLTAVETKETKVGLRVAVTDNTKEGDQ